MTDLELLIVSQILNLDLAVHYVKKDRNGRYNSSITTYNGRGEAVTKTLGTVLFYTDH